MLSPEDKRTLIDFAGPLFAQSKEIDAMYYNDARPKTDGMPDSGIARGIQDALERDFALSQAPRRVEAYMPQLPPEIPMPQYVPAHMPQYAQPVPVSNPDQLEFKFDTAAQDKTNTLLEAQNKLIKELIKKFDKLLSVLNDSDKIQS
jgi:hypothetical protein